MQHRQVWRLSARSLPTPYDALPDEVAGRYQRSPPENDGRAGAGCPPATLLSPPRDQRLVGACQAAQLRGGLRLRLVEAALAEPKQDARRLGQELRTVVPVGEDLLQLDHAAVVSSLGQLMPVRVPLRGARQGGHDEVAGAGSGMILIHPRQDRTRVR